jgi:hypothetical protein
MYKTIRKGKVHEVYRVAYNCFPHPDTTKVRFSSKDKIVGTDYWTYIETWVPTTSYRLLSIMSRLERANRTDCWLYIKVKKMAYKEIFGVEI